MCKQLHNMDHIIPGPVMDYYIYCICMNLRQLGSMHRLISVYIACGKKSEMATGDW